ncbi:hypothetical protein [Cumulibacter soli]|uniref:hypothetical protein n=1 Tax=Cumulibacter soli TaxID=2546344 RepID=UPI0010683E8D|nr:hypothetical protein [Cumulibacter soli]
MTAHSPRARRPRRGARAFRSYLPRRNRRRGAPLSLTVRRLIAATLAGCAGLLALQPAFANPASSDDVQQQPDRPSAGIPLVLPIADPASASVLRPGDYVDVYVAVDDAPPKLTLSAVPLVEVQRSDSNLTSTTSIYGTATYIVVQITSDDTDLVASLLSAQMIIATVSAVDSD